MGKKVIFVGKSPVFGAIFRTMPRKRFIQFSSQFRPNAICPQTINLVSDF